MKSLKYLCLSVIVFWGCSSDKDQRFVSVAHQSGISFENTLSYTESFNPYTYRNFYNGGGVALGDINNDGLQDLFFTGNLVSNKLYLNKGQWRFEDITKSAGVASPDVWSTGVTFVDINSDGWLDIYVCKSGKPEGPRRYNELFINNGDLTFTEAAKDYGLDILGLSVHAAFLDFDKDGDLDCYILNNSIRSVGGYDLIKGQREIPDPNNNGNKFLENRDGYFVDVTQKVGMYTSAIGFGLGITISDFNNDTWPDLFISNDFFEKDYLYINNQKGGFDEVSESYFDALSMGSMGADSADLDNDLFTDLLVTEMLPATLERKKLKAKYDSWDKFSLMMRQGYGKQYPRNMLQRNMGDAGFFDISRKTNVAATEWSWASLLFDMDNDGLRDIFIANGINKDLLDRDYLSYMANEQQVRLMLQDQKQVVKNLIDIMPDSAVPNFIFHNQGDFIFKEKTADWGLGTPSFSNGSAYGDLDNDGDLDLVVNNVNMPAFVYKNQTDTLTNRSLNLKLQSVSKNNFAIGAKVFVYYNKQKAMGELFPSRGFQSSISYPLHFGVGSTKTVDSVQVIWPNQVAKVYQNLPTNKMVVLNENEGERRAINTPTKSQKPRSRPFIHKHSENNFSEFNKERLITQMRSNEGPALAVADLNGDGYDDVFIGGAKGQIAALYKSDGNGSYTKIEAPFQEDIDAEDTNALFFDANADQHLDLLVASGGRAFSQYSTSLNDRLYLNDGNGNFIKDPTAIRYERFFSSKALAVADYNQDGHLDYFVGERYDLQTIGKKADGFLMQNNGAGKFAIDQQPALQQLGMITDAHWFDLNSDNWPDLIVAGEWMPITILINNKGVFENQTHKYGLSHTSGLWNTIHLTDLNQDGRIDFIAGNLGTNTFMEPQMRLYINDFDGNGTEEQILCLNRAGKYYPFLDKDELIAQLPSLKKKFTYYKEYASKTIEDLFSKDQIQNAQILSVDRLESTVFLQNQNGFESQSLPEEIQYAPIYEIVEIQALKSQEKKFYLGGNQYLVKPQYGSYDASKGWELGLKKTNNNSINFDPPRALNISGQIRGIKRIKTENKSFLIFAINDEEVLFYELE
ncbi:MAG: VCBS repeat-containing protein [Bacteroidetes bacterium]|nr:VCBS repeat-containing protein [Bacteroidota bacterium]MDA0937916.1 VCBS repeat-containing protein [Bacteroidota bacterium]MDA1344054.1 VCBS repeat-containing protein [Bacteroidota bacterium]